MEETSKKCIACAENIKLEAELCRYCHTKQSDPNFRKTNSKEKQTFREEKSKLISRGIVQDEVICRTCNQFVLESQYYDKCSHCRGETREGTLPRKVSASSISQIDEDSLLANPSTQPNKSSSAGIWVILSVLVLLVLIMSAANGTNNMNPQGVPGSISVPESNDTATDEISNQNKGHWESICNTVSVPNPNYNSSDPLSIPIIYTQECSNQWVED